MEKLTRKQSKERTRNRLIAGLIDIVRRDGLTGLTTSRVAESAGVSQSNFYVHFKDMDEALSCAAEVIAGEVRASVQAGRQDIDPAVPGPSIRGAVAAAINALVDEPRFTELFLALRRDASSPMGARFRLLLDDARAELLADVERMGFTRDVLPDVDCYAELLIGHTLAVVEGLLDGRLTDRERAVDVLSGVLLAMFQAAQLSIARARESA